MIRKAFRRRSDSDYGFLFSLDKSEVKEMLSEMKDFITTIESYIKTVSA